ncbi:hypothetical protein RIF23_05850 [Lipingzhangella sp. LS1_29]|uniref:AbiEi antitoxin of type IV toxin-antitoxin system n=1 Tax=Lipingzhangella rawalii TaxID=2055835 RepID=A0ABU2H3E0_9ACTN|nr:hypothetical protein [Lipingzhangella rawalii]MDS1269816.1 hypothetical protein [Lipingzhangella rawalii]
MPVREPHPNHALNTLLREQDHVLSREQALALGFTPAAIKHRTRRGGPWRVGPRGVYFAFPTQPTRNQQQIAALLYAGPRSLLTGAAALGHYRMRYLPEPTDIDLLIPHDEAVLSRRGIDVHRTRRMPKPRMHGPFRLAPAYRAVADAVRKTSMPNVARALVSEAVQSGICTVAQLDTELRDGPIRDSAMLRDVLSEVMAGAASAPECEAVHLVKTSGLPQPLWNPKLLAPDGSLLCIPDAWWQEHLVALEIESYEWHVNAEHWARTLRRRALAAAHGVRVLPFTPRQIRSDPDGFIETLRLALAAPGVVIGR